MSTRTGAKVDEAMHNFKFTYYSPSMPHDRAMTGALTPKGHCQWQTWERWSAFVVCNPQPYLSEYAFVPASDVSEKMLFNY